eukprot:COSAG01_NODE_6554_length_3611_cov_1.222665_1_plen_185_part_00
MLPLRASAAATGVDPASAASAALASFERDGYAVVDALALAPGEVAELRCDLERWCAAQLEPSADRQWEGALPADCVDDGWGRAGASNVLVEMADSGCIPRKTLDFMLSPDVMDFAQAALRSGRFAIDDASVAGYPMVGEAGNCGPAGRGGSNLHGWHRDSFNLHQHLCGFHLHARAAMQRRCQR